MPIELNTIGRGQACHFPTQGTVDHQCEMARTPGKANGQRTGRMGGCCMAARGEGESEKTFTRKA